VVAVCAQALTLTLSQRERESNCTTPKTNQSLSYIPLKYNLAVFDSNIS